MCKRYPLLAIYHQPAGLWIEQWSLPLPLNIWCSELVSLEYNVMMMGFAKEYLSHLITQFADFIIHSVRPSVKGQINDRILLSHLLYTTYRSLLRWGDRNISLNTEDHYQRKRNNQINTSGESNIYLYHQQWVLLKNCHKTVP